MTSPTTTRHRATFVALAVAAVTLLAPSAAFAAHDLLVYKMEKQVRMDQDEMDVSLSCRREVTPATDPATFIDPPDYAYAMDGMWRIDHVDQDDPPQKNQDLKTGVDVTEARLDPTDTNFSTYKFHFVKNANGDAQLKVFVTCMRTVSDTAAGHYHDLKFNGGLNTSAPAITAAGPGTELASAACLPGEVLTSPGFLYKPFTTGNQTGRELASYPTDDTNLKKSLYQRTWAFDMQAVNDKVDLSYRCLKVKIRDGSSGNQSKHKFTVGWVGTAWPTNAPYPFTSTLTAANTTVPLPEGGDGRYDEVRSICGDHSKGLVSGWWQGNGPTPWSADGSVLDGAGDNKADVWYLGQDPRLKSRAFRFLTEVASQSVTSGLLCFNDRTT